ncbi:hypothetical protein Vadar_018579 [Vaccinium darrowii]|uniref:Uncharacterized protein n=1 Tax=Vaccinium darrowii TaxID=229202 RepID=A0ACB7XIE5_9ERIC|nr:hypothetical protein Vadar_018579 [Vaccinium darrowii]
MVAYFLVIAASDGISHFQDNVKYFLTKVEIGREWRNLPQEKKEKYVNEAKLANDRLAYEKKRLGNLLQSDLPKPKKRKIQTRIALNQIKEIVDKFNDDQRDAVKLIGLGGILGLRCTMLNHGLCQWLVDKFDPDKSSLNVHGREFVLTEFNVHECLGINAKGNTRKMNIADGFEKLCLDLGVSKVVVQFQQLTGYLGSVKEADDDFKIKFALYILGSFLCPTTKPAVNQSYIHLVSDVRGMENVNWAKITLDFLCQGIRVQRSNGLVQANGCLFLLLVFYFDHVSPTGLPIPRTNPRLAIWGDREIKDVLREFKVIGGYKKEGVRVTFTTEEEGNEGPKTRAKEGSSSHCMSCNEVMNTLATILDRQTSVIERQYGSQLPYNFQVPHKHVAVTRKWGSPYKGERTSNPVTFRTPPFAFGEHSKGHGHFTEENKEGPTAFTPQSKTPQSKSDTPKTSIDPVGDAGKSDTTKTNIGSGGDDIEFLRFPLSCFKPTVPLSRGRKRKMPHSKSRPCSKMNIEYEPPQLRHRDELKKSQLIRSPYTRDCRKKRNPFKKLDLGGVNSPIHV